MLQTIARKGLMIAAALLLAIGFGLSAPASATDSMTFHPQTAAGGLTPNDPNYWFNQALVTFDGGGLSTQNVVLAPSNTFVTSNSTSTSTTYDTSTHTTPTTVEGNQNNTTVDTGATQGAGSSLSISTDNSGSP